MPKKAVSEICEELKKLQRQRAVILKSRNMQSNRLQAVIAGTIGYSPSLPEKERAKKFKEAANVIKGIVDEGENHELKDVVLITMKGIDAFNELKESLEKRMVHMASVLPAASWVEKPERRGFGLLFLAIVVGETGDLANYDNPGKLWRRLGCAPWTFNNQTHMGCTWKSAAKGKVKGIPKLPKEEWEKFGYSPRRRSIAYLIGENIVKQNGPDSEKVVEKKEKKGYKVRLKSGPYHARYVTAKILFKKKHKDASDLHCHRHAMLLGTKLLLKELWAFWNNR